MPNQSQNFGLAGTIKQQLWRKKKHVSTWQHHNPAPKSSRNNIFDYSCNFFQISCPFAPKFSAGPRKKGELLGRAPGGRELAVAVSNCRKPSKRYMIWILQRMITARVLDTRWAIPTQAIIMCVIQCICTCCSRGEEMQINNNNNNNAP